MQGSALTAAADVDRGAALGDLERWISLPALAVLAWLAMFVWSYWTTLVELVTFWQENPDYSSGQVVPLVAIYVLWKDRQALSKLQRRVYWPGLIVLLAAQAVRLYGLYDMYGSLERYSMLLTLGGSVLFLFGPSVAWRMKWVFAFLLLMVPFPGRIHNGISVPLQTFATTSAVYGLELLGYLVAREGNVLRLNAETVVAVAEACSGLRMLNAFIIVSAILAFVVRRPAWQKAIVILSSIPVAILANTLRLIVTVLLFDLVGDKAAERFFHDFAGLSMMPFAVVVVVVEFQLLRYLSKDTKEAAHG